MVEQHEPSDLRRVLESSPGIEERYDRLRAAAQQVLDEVQPGPDESDRVTVSRVAIEALAAVLAAASPLV